MAVKIKLESKFNQNDLKKFIAERIGRVEAAVLSRLHEVGEIFVTNARNNDTYRDRSGNLRSSIGYVVLKNGEQLVENFQTFPPKKANAKGSKVTGTKNGQQVAKDFISEVKQNFPTGLVLICVAGMDYAASVEARGYDVITGSSLQAETDLKKALEALKGKMEKMK
jgi:hypothetical protein